MFGVSCWTVQSQHKRVRLGSQQFVGVELEVKETKNAANNNILFYFSAIPFNIYYGFVLYHTATYSGVDDMVLLGISYQQILRLNRQHILAGFVYRLLAILSQALTHARHGKPFITCHISITSTWVCSNQFSLYCFHPRLLLLPPTKKPKNCPSDMWGKSENLIIVLGVGFSRSVAEIDRTGSRYTAPTNCLWTVSLASVPWALSYTE